MSNILSIVLLLASIGLFFGYIDPAYGKIRESRVEKLEYDQALTNSEDLRAERDKLLKKYNAMPASEVDRLGKLLPDNIDNVRLVIDIDEMAKTYGMRIRNFKTETVQKTDAIGADPSVYGTLKLSFSTTASYATFLGFLHDLERSLRLIDVTSVSFVPTDAGLYDFSVTVKTYWLK
jgi:Tfp pilus assembly protein PilO